MNNGFVIEGMSPSTLAKKLVEVGEAYNVYQELAKLLPTREEIKITVDATAVQEVIDKAGLYGEIDVMVEAVQCNVYDCRQDMIDAMGRQYRNVSILQFHPGEEYRRELLRLAAMVINAVKEFDNEQRG